MNPIDIIHSLKDRKIIILILLTIQVSFLVRAMEPSLDQYQDGIAVIDAQEHVNDQEEQLPATLWLPSDDSHADLLELNRFVRRNLNADVEQEGVLNVNMDALECLATLGRAPLCGSLPGGKNCLHYIAKRGDLEDLRRLYGLIPAALKKILLCMGDDNGCSPLFDAVSAEKIENVRFLLAAGAPLDQLDNRGRSVLHHAFMRDSVALVDMLLKQRADRIVDCRGINYNDGMVRRIPARCSFFRSDSVSGPFFKINTY